MIHHQAAFSPKSEEGQLPSGEVFFHDGMGLFALPAAPMEPVDQFAAIYVPVGDNAEDLVALRLHRHGGKGELSLHPGKPRVAEVHGWRHTGRRGHFCDEQSHRGQSRPRPIPCRSFSFLLDLFRHRLPLFRFGNRLFELLRHISADGELDPAEASCLLSSRSTGADHADTLRYRNGGTPFVTPSGSRSRASLRTRSCSYPAGTFPSRNSVWRYQFLFGPPDVERLICFVSLVGEQGIFFLCCER